MSNNIRADQEGLILLHDNSSLIVRKDGTKLSGTGNSITGTFAAGSGAAFKVDSTSTGGSGSTAYTFGDIVAACKKAGVIAP